jgi:hypothetical protein
LSREAGWFRVRGELGLDRDSPSQNPKNHFRKIETTDGCRYTIGKTIFSSEFIGVHLRLI